MFESTRKPKPLSLSRNLCSYAVLAETDNKLCYLSSPEETSERYARLSLSLLRSGNEAAFEISEKRSVSVVLPRHDHIKQLGGSITLSALSIAT